MSINQFRKEVAKGQRFEFGKNWKNFLTKLNDERIYMSQLSLTGILGITSLSDKSFLDVGCGSGLSSLVAKNLGANVTSFDFDETSVWCTSELKKRYFMNDKSWVIMQGSVLDRDFLGELGKFDIVYSWGVLHHTGKMWAAIDNCLNLVNDDGKFFIAIYNDQGFKTHFWWMIKWLYNKSPRILQKPFAFLTCFFVQFLMLLKYTLKLKPTVFFRSFFNYKQKRGMSMLSDIVDWYGGFPYEFATYDYLVDYIQSKGFELQKGKEKSSHGCHELLFKRV